MISSLSNTGFLSPQSLQKSLNTAPIEEILEEAEAAEENSDGQQAIQTLTEGSGSALDNELTEEEQRQLDELQARDREVRAHEQAHKTVGGPYAGAISYETQTGPDGREYAIGGEVQIDASPIPGNPEATVRKLDVVIRAALAPAEPSSQDFAVARAAQAARLQAQREVSEQREAEQAERRSENTNIEENGKNTLNGDQQSQLTQLLQSINVIETGPDSARGNLFDAIN